MWLYLINFILVISLIKVSLFNHVTNFWLLLKIFNELTKMNTFVCEITGCKHSTHQYASKYALEKHQRINHPSDTSNTILTGKRKRWSISSSPCCGDDNNNEQASFSGLCVCGTLMRDNYNLTRHISKCPVIVPSKETLDTINYTRL